MNYNEALILLSENREIHFNGEYPYLCDHHEYNKEKIDVNLFNRLLSANAIGLRGGSKLSFVITDWARKYARQLKQEQTTPAG